MLATTLSLGIMVIIIRIALIVLVTFPYITIVVNIAVENMLYFK